MYRILDSKLKEDSFNLNNFIGLFNIFDESFLENESEVA